ncbi:MAG: molybdenum cofactor biosynthesis protein MoaE [Candidatus Eremiobacteraeota bacterium]|nr:molybdenum cofactor biosynthesis protein MoaE [Candidatus Eremiobacteraeota bacterium]
MVRIVRRSIDIAALASQVSCSSYGAIVTFAGVVRDRSDDDRDVTGLSYESYEPMAIAEIERIVEEARARFGDCDAAVEHRTGDLAIGEISVGIAVASPHRAQAFDVCEFIIDELKHRAPIWKREHYTQGPSEWKACHSETRH